MSWVDVKDAVNLEVNNTKNIINHKLDTTARNVNTGVNNFTQGVADTVHDNTLPVREIAGDVSNAVNDFQTKGNQEGYAEAIWQDVVQPIAGSSTSRGAIAGGAGALGMDLLDPTPGINPMNIAGGAGVGAAVGTALPYAYDAVQAMSSPNSLLRGSTYSKALEGAGIATGITGEVDQGIQDMIEPGFGEEFTERGLNIAKNTGEGINNAYQGALAGTNQLGSDVAGFFGFDGVEEMYQVLADNRRKAQTPNSAMGAMAQELSYDAGMGGVLGKATDTLMGAGKGIKAWSNSNVYKRAEEAVKSGTEKLLGKYGGVASSGTTKKAIEQIKNQDTMWAGTRMLADFTGTFSKPTKEFIERNWDMVSANLFGGKSASLRKANSETIGKRDLMSEIRHGKGFDDLSKMEQLTVSTEIAKMNKEIIKNPDKFKRLMTELGTMPSSASTKLFGTGTAITADVED